MYLYKENKQNKLEPIDFQRNSSYKNFFGVSRGARSLSVEIGGLLKGIDSTQWKKVSKDHNLNENYITSDAIAVENNAIHPKLKDTILLEYREKTPWAWIKSYEEIKMPSKTLKLYVKIPE